MTAVHILRPRGYYIGQVRAFGFRRWNTVTRACRTPETALQIIALKMKGQKRGRVLFVDTSGYYDPHVSMECSHV